MRQSAYLFLGGPLDQQWRAVPDRAPMVAAQESAGIHAQATTGQIVRYRRAYTSLPGWVVPLTFYVAAGRAVHALGDVLPGGVVGERWDVWPAHRSELYHLAFPAEALRDLHYAIQRRDYRP